MSGWHRDNPELVGTDADPWMANPAHAAAAREGSKGDTYVVSFHGETGVHCTCPGFKYRQDCKHVTQAYKTACMYNPQYNDGKPEPAIRPRDYTYDAFSKALCPACGGPMVYVKRAV